MTAPGQPTSCGELTQEGRNAGARLRQFRYSKGIHMVAMADAMNVSRAAYYRYEAGQVVKLTTVRLIANLLEITFSQAIAPLTVHEELAAVGLSPEKAASVIEVVKQSVSVGQPADEAPSC